MSEEASAEQKKQRVMSIDLVKDVAIVGVVILHVALLQAHGPAPETTTGVGIMTFKPIPYSMLCMFIAKLLASPFVTFDTTTWVPVGTLAGILLALITVAIIVLASVGLGRLRKKESA
jgi:surface polysaccharide O-acyltransferase-like enzyme